MPLIALVVYTSKPGYLRFGDVVDGHHEDQNGDNGKNGRDKVENVEIFIENVIEFSGYPQAAP